MKSLNATIHKRFAWRRQYCLCFELQGKLEENSQPFLVLEKSIDNRAWILLLLEIQNTSIILFFNSSQQKKNDIYSCIYY